MNKRFITFVLLAMMLVGALFLSACGAEQEPAEVDENGEIRVAMFILVRANEYDEARINGVESKAAELNAKVDYFSAEYNTQEQINQIQDAITAGVYDAFIIHANDSNAVVPAIQDALAEGIIVIGADGPFGPDTRTLDPYPDGVSSIVGRTGWTTGTWLGQAVVAASEGLDEVKVAYLIGIQAMSIDQDRYEAMEEVISAYPNIEVVSLQEGQYRRDISRQVMQNVFVANPDINVVVSSGDQMTLGAYDAAAEAGIEANIKFIGNGASKEGWEAIKDGRFFASYADIPYTQGQILIETVSKALNGETVPTFINLEEQSPPMPAGGPMIYKDNISNFEAEW